ncbi:MAG TPA: DUF3320 domain-containing protein, partial [Sphingomicrobium sp.]
VPLGQMVDYVARIVDLEGPIHLDEIVARIRIMWGLGRAGARIRAAVERAVRTAAEQRLVEGGPFYAKPGLPIGVRDRAQVQSATLRKPEMLPPAEIEAAAILIVKANYGASRAELVQTLSRCFGFASTSAQLRLALEGGIDRSLAAGTLSLQGEVLVLAS